MPDVQTAKGKSSLLPQSSLQVGDYLNSLSPSPPRSPSSPCVESARFDSTRKTASYRAELQPIAYNIFPDQLEPSACRQS